MHRKASTHFLLLIFVTIVTAIAHYAIYYAALIRGYEASSYTASRNLFLILFLAFIPVVLKRILKYEGGFEVFTLSVVLFAIGLTVQYRLFSDPEYTSRRDKAEARAMKVETFQMNYITENYSAEKKQFMGLPATPPTPVDLSTVTVRPSTETFTGVLFSGKTITTVMGIIGMFGAFLLFCRNDVMDFLRRNGFAIALLTLVPLLFAAIWSRAGKFGDNLTPWELAKVPFLIGFAAILAILYKDLSRTNWGIPRAKDLLPLLFMAGLPFIPFFLLKDFGQMMVFTAAYSSIYLIAVRKWPQRLLYVGSVLFIISVLVVGALPQKTQERVPLLPTLAGPVKLILPDRIQQRFHLWLDGFNPPSPDTSWWKTDYDTYFAKLVEKDPGLPQLVADNPGLQNSINVDAWFDILAFQPAQATFGVVSGGTTGRGLGLGYPELIPVADSDYIFAAIGEELGTFGGVLVILAIIAFSIAGISIARGSRDMFGKLCAVGLTAIISFQALVNMGGITRALPMTGITFPFVSHGGFSLITSFIMLGMLMAISHRNRIDNKNDLVE